MPRHMQKADFYGDSVMWHRTLWSIAAGYCSPAVAVIDIFAA